MPTAAWIAYDIIVAVLGYIASDRTLTRREKGVVAVVIIAGLGVAAYSGYSDYSDHRDNEALHKQINDMQRTQAYNTGQLDVLAKIDVKTLGLLADRVGTAPVVGASTIAEAAVRKIDALQNVINRYVLPRSLTAEQSKIMSSFLSKNPSQTAAVVIAKNDDEVRRYAADIENALTKGKWVVLSGGESDDLSPGLESSFQGNYAPPTPIPMALFNEALAAAHVGIDGMSMSGGGPEKFTIQVGRRRRGD
jgi:hypothetical protein